MNQSIKWINQWSINETVRCPVDSLFHLITNDYVVQCPLTLNVGVDSAGLCVRCACFHHFIVFLFFTTLFGVLWSMQTKLSLFEYDVHWTCSSSIYLFCILSGLTPTEPYLRKRIEIKGLRVFSSPRTQLAAFAAKCRMNPELQHFCTADAPCASFMDRANDHGPLEYCKHPHAALTFILGPFFYIYTLWLFQFHGSAVAQIYG